MTAKVWSSSLTSQRSASTPGSTTVRSPLTSTGMLATRASSSPAVGVGTDQQPVRQRATALGRRGGQDQAVTVDARA